MTTSNARDSNALFERLEFYAAMGRAGNFSAAALLVAFNLLYRHLNGRTGRCDPARATLAGETGLDERSIRRAIRELTMPAPGPDYGSFIPCRVRAKWVTRLGSTTVGRAVPV